MTSRPYPAVAAGGAAVQHKETMMDDLADRVMMLTDKDTGKEWVLAEDYRALEADLAEARAEINDLREVLDEKRRLAREIDVALHGSTGAAKQPSLCDLVHPAQKMRADLAEARAQMAALWKAGSDLSSYSRAHTQLGQQWVLAQSDLMRLEAAVKDASDAAKRHEAEVRADERRKVLEEAHSLIVGQADFRGSAASAYSTMTDKSNPPLTQQGHLENQRLISSLRAREDELRRVADTIRALINKEPGHE